MKVLVKVKTDERLTEDSLPMADSFMVVDKDFNIGCICASPGVYYSKSGEPCFMHRNERAKMENKHFMEAMERL
jgi:hypothetical protein